MKFDAYAGNVSAGVTAGQLAELAAIGVKGRAERGRPRGRYHDCYDVKIGSDLAGWVGHDQQLDTAYFEFKGQPTPEAVGTLRRHFKDQHTVSRLDACEDYDDASAFARLAELIDLVKDPRVKSDAILPRDGDRGRTFYWGSTQSRVMVRLYEAGKMKDRLHYMRPDWVRAEAQIRPGKAVEKAHAAYVTPIEAWGFGEWSRRAAESLCQVEVPRFAPPAQPAEFDRTRLYIARAFRRHWEESLKDLGDWECIGREMQAIWAADDAAQATLARRASGGADQD